MSCLPDGSWFESAIPSKWTLAIVFAIFAFVALRTLPPGYR